MSDQQRYSFDYKMILVFDGDEPLELAEIVKRLNALNSIQAKLENIVCTVEPDAGVVLLSEHGTTHEEVWNGKTVQVYDHEYFSPLGDALMEVWKLAKGDDP